MADVNFGDVIEDWLAGFPLLTILSYRLGALHSIEVALALITQPSQVQSQSILLLQMSF